MGHLKENIKVFQLFDQIEFSKQYLYPLDHACHACSNKSLSKAVN